MWLTGFDVPSLATLYLDKPLKAHTLMQAIARANRVHEGKNNGLIVDYCGILKNLRKALARFAGQGDTGHGGTGGEEDPTHPEEELLESLAEAISLSRAFLTGNWCRARMRRQSISSSSTRPCSTSTILPPPISTVCRESNSAATLVNGIPLVIAEYKSYLTSGKDWTEAVHQLHRYQRQAPLMLAPNVFCIAADEDAFALATAAECLKVVENALPTQTHRDNMLDHKLDMNVCARASTADDTPEAIALENQEPEPVRNVVTIVRFTTSSAAMHRGVALQVRS